MNFKRYTYIKYCDEYAMFYIRERFSVLRICQTALRALSVVSIIACAMLWLYIRGPAIFIVTLAASVLMSVLFFCLAELIELLLKTEESAYNTAIHSYVSTRLLGDILERLN